MNYIKQKKLKSNFHFTALLTRNRLYLTFFLKHLLTSKSLCKSLNTSTKSKNNPIQPLIQYSLCNAPFRSASHQKIKVLNAFNTSNTFNITKCNYITCFFNKFWDTILKCDVFSNNRNINGYLKCN